MNASSGMGMVGAIVWMVVLFGIMYFLMLRPQKKEQKRLQAMLNDMEAVSYTHLTLPTNREV